MKKIGLFIILSLMLSACEAREKYHYAGTSDDSTLTMVSATKRIPVLFLLSDTIEGYDVAAGPFSDSEDRFKYVGRVYELDKQSMNAMDHIFFALADEKDDVKKLDVKVPSNKPLFVRSEYYEKLGATVKRCGPVVGSLIPKPKAKYVATFQMEALRCGITISDVTNPMVPAIVFPTTGKQ